jgi:hypothetical protein
MLFTRQCAAYGGMLFIIHGFMLSPLPRGDAAQAAMDCFISFRRRLRSLDFSQSIHIPVKFHPQFNLNLCS